MSYATKDDVKALFRDWCDNDDAAVNDADLDLLLTNHAAMIDSKIGTLYQLPITLADNPQSFAVLKQIHMYLVACDADDIINDYESAEKKPMWCKKAYKMLKGLVPDKEKGCKQCEPTMKLPDAEYLGTSIQRNQIKIGATSGQVFRKGQDNW